MIIANQLEVFIADQLEVGFDTLGQRVNLGWFMDSVLQCVATLNADDIEVLIKELRKARVKLKANPAREVKLS